MKEIYCAVNGSILPLHEATVNVTDIGISRGYGVYDGIAARNGTIFRFEDHWTRFQNSAHALGLIVPAEKDTAEALTKELLIKNGFTARANIRLLLTGGPSIGGIEFNPNACTFIILVEQHEALPASLYSAGGKLITHEYQRFMPEYKTTHYITAVTLQQKRKSAGAIEILYHANGKILECATSNFFMVKNKTLITPQKNVLGGITRKVVMELAGPDFAVEMRDIPLSELQSADELFMTSSFKDIVPIVDIDGTPYGGGKPGPVTQELAKRFAEYFAKTA